MARYVLSSTKWVASGTWAGVPSPPGAGASVLYLHHSTGAKIWAGGIERALETENSRSESDARIVKWTYPSAPYPWRNDPYDYWRLWVKHRGGRGWLGQPTLEMLARKWDVIVVSTASRPRAWNLTRPARPRTRRDGRPRTTGAS